MPKSTILEILLNVSATRRERYLTMHVQRPIYMYKSYYKRVIIEIYLPIRKKIIRKMCTYECRKAYSKKTNKCF